MINEDFADRIHDWEREIRDAGFDLSHLQAAAPDLDRVLLVGLLTDGMSDQQFQDSIAELV